MEFITEFFTSGDVWSVIIKVLVTALLTGLVTLSGTVIGKIIANSKNSKIRAYAKTCVEAAEVKFPNEGKKMGPEKMQYVMDQLMIKFPRIRDDKYLYNIAEAAVYHLNKEMQNEAAIKDFEEKYGEEPLAVQEKYLNQKQEEFYENANSVVETVELISEKESTDKNNVSNSTTQKKTAPQNRLKSF